MIDDYFDDNSFAILLKAARKRKNLTQQQVSDAVGIKRSAYAYYELGKSQPSLEKLKLIADVLDVSCDYLVSSTRVLQSPRSEYDTGKPQDKELDNINSIDDVIFRKVSALTDLEKQEVLDFILKLNFDKKEKEQAAD